MDLPSVFSEMVPALPFYRARGTPCYMHVLCDIFLGKKIRGLRSCPVVGDVPLLEKRPLSFDAVATCLDICGSMDVAATTRRVMIIPVVTCLSFGLTGVEGRGLGGVNHGVILLRSRE
jgi:hypothetical protein